MYIIKRNSTLELVVKNSRFICNIIFTDNMDNAHTLLNNIKKQYSDATHNCYAINFETTSQSSDDGEPLHTAGLPMLNVLQKNKMINTLCVVTRYYGGIKLGTGGLVRAYTKCAAECLKLAEKIEYIKNIKIKFNTDYNKLSEIENYLKSYTQISKSFNEQILLEYTVPEVEFKNIKNQLNVFFVKKIDIIQ